MRSALLAALLLALAAGQIGTTALVLVRHQRGQRRAEALRARTEEEEETDRLTHLTVRLDEVDATLVRVGRREVRYEGHLFDVVFEEQCGDTLHLWVHWDREEEEAVAWLAETFEGPARDAGAATAPHPEALHPLYVALDRGVMQRPAPEPLRYAAAASQVTEAPFDDVPHPPPRA